MKLKIILKVVIPMLVLFIVDSTALGQYGAGANTPGPNNNFVKMAALNPKGRSNDAIPISNQASQRFTNSLGQIFVPVPGTKVWFCVCDVRVQDYQAYALSNSGVDGSWENPPLENKPVTPTKDCPVVNVTWTEATAFCAWLTRKEQATGIISHSQSYRLPMDWEWSKAVGLKEWKHGTPEHKSKKITGVYPWGKQWPPPSGAGNYGESLGVDDFEFTSPVGSFAANQYGLYDMGGNVWQWCEDWYNSKQQYRVLRGASWSDFGAVGLLSSYRNISVPGLRDFNIGFRVVLVGVGPAR